ncbi:MAG: tyrosine-type recombinase/integrase [Lachnospiraceae bacterium]|nr:tyrosine-type recombinase/integrase [Lachnospiraceae bacterium]
MLDVSMSDAELLKFAIENGMLDAALVQEKIEMQKREEILRKHPYDIWEGKNGKWYTYLPDKEKGRILKKRVTKELIEQDIIIYYCAEEEKQMLSFENCFFRYADLKKEIVSANTYDRYIQDHKRYFKGTGFNSCDITRITSEQIDLFIIKRTKDLKLRKKAMKAMYGYIQAVFLSARVNRIISENPCDFINKVNFYFKYCHVDMCSIEKRIISKEQMRLLKEQFERDYAYKPQYIPTYAVEFASLTGMRVGEIAALTWESIKDDIIVVDKEEIYEQSTNTYYVADYTKNRKPRIVPITEEIRKHLARIRNVEESLGYIGKYVFSDQNGRVSKRRISECARNKSIQIGIDVKTIHSYRRTINSAMKIQGASSVVASSILGNTETVNDNYYTYDITDIAYKKSVLENAYEMMV